MSIRCTSTSNVYWSCLRRRIWASNSAGVLMRASSCSALISAHIAINRICLLTRCPALFFMHRGLSVLAFSAPSLGFPFLEDLPPMAQVMRRAPVEGRRLSSERLPRFHYIWCVICSRDRPLYSWLTSEFLSVALRRSASSML